MQSPAALPESTHSSGPVASAPGGWWAVCLCAAWCGTCGVYRPLFDELARAHPDVRFEWVDIEDDSELAGDLDVETFPTLLIADGERAQFLGPLLPQA
ncbi:MAG: thioredoxin, partial [Comamonadaceae bacterium]